MNHSSTLRIPPLRLRSMTGIWATDIVVLYIFSFSFFFIFSPFLSFSFLLLHPPPLTHLHPSPTPTFRAHPRLGVYWMSGCLWSSNRSMKGHSRGMHPG